MTGTPRRCPTPAAAGSPAGTIQQAWASLVGPETTHMDTVMSLGLGALGALTAPRLSGAPRSGLRDLVLAALALDLWGGAWANNTLACARWYERPGQRDADHLRFAVVHLHPFVLALLDSTQGVPASAAWRGAAVRYGFLITATVLIRRSPLRRPLAAVLTAAGTALDAGVGRSVSAPWFAPVFYTKLLFGHAGAVLWHGSEVRTGGGPRAETPAYPEDACPAET